MSGNDNIPKGWKETTLSEIAEIVMGQSPKGNTCNINMVGIPLINGPTEFTEVYPKPVQYTTDAKRISDVNDLLFCVRGSTTGRMNWANQKYAIGRGVAAIRHRHGDSYKKFIKGVFDYNLQKLLAEATGSTFPNVSRSQLESMEILAPPLIEQQSIASILTSFDDKIELLQAQNETLETMAQTIFKEWFGKYQVGDELPEGWRVGSLSDIADFLNGLALQKYPPIEGEESLPVIKIRELRQGITENSDRANKTLDPKYIINNGDVLFSWSGSLVVKIWQNGEGALNQHLFKVTSEVYPKWFYYFWTIYHLNMFRAIASDKATTMGHINRKHLDMAEVVIPNEVTLKSLDKLFVPLMEKIETNAQQIQSLQQTRDTLLPKLMNGQLRVDEFKD